MACGIVGGQQAFWVVANGWMRAVEVEIDARMPARCLLT